MQIPTEVDVRRALTPDDKPAEEVDELPCIGQGADRSDARDNNVTLFPTKK